MADYGKQRSGRPAKVGPPHREHNAPGGPANPFGNRPDKAALLDRLKASAQRDQAAEPDEATVVRSEGDA